MIVIGYKIINTGSVILINKLNPKFEITKLKIQTYSTSFLYETFVSTVEYKGIYSIGGNGQYRFIIKDLSGNIHTFDSGAKLYVNNMLVTELIFDESVTKINAFAFRGLHYVTKVVVANPNATIGRDAFAEMPDLVSYSGPALS